MNIFCKCNNKEEALFSRSVVETGLLNMRKEDLKEYEHEKIKLSLTWEDEKEKNKMMKLTDTVEGMNSADYKERFKAEYYQLKIRFVGLMNMCGKWDRNELTFDPTCPRSTYDLQLKAMRDYMAILEMRAVMEGIELDTSVSSVE